VRVQARASRPSAGDDASRHPNERPNSGPRADRPSSRSAAIVLVVVVPAVAVMGLFLAQYFVHDYAVPVGSDTAQGIWRAQVVTEIGLDGLPPSGPALLDASTDRPGLPVTMALLHSATGLDAMHLSFVLPAVVAAAIALAAGAFAVAVLAEPRWTFSVYAVLVGASVNVELMAAGYFDNLLAAAAVMAACVAVLLAVDGRRGGVLAVVLLAGATLFHWMFAAFFVGLLGLLWLALLPRSLRDHRDGAPMSETPAARLAAIVLGAGALGAAGLAASPGGFVVSTGPARGEVLDKLGRLAPLAALVPAAVLSVAGAWFLRGTSRRRWGRLLLVLWAGSAVVAAAAVALGARLPAHRAAAFSLAVPLLCAAGLVGIARRIGGTSGSEASGAGASEGGRGPTMRQVVAAGLVVLVVGGSVVVAASSWFARPPYVNELRQRQVEQIVATVDGVEQGRSVVLVVDAPSLPGYGATPAIRRVRAALDPTRVDDVHVFIGEPEDLFAGRPTDRPEDPDFSAASREVFEASRERVTADPVAVVARLYNKDFDAIARNYPEASTSDGLLAIGASIPAEISAPPAAPSAPMLILGAVAVGAVLALVGLGWSWTLIAARAADRIALAPAVGLAVCALVGTAADRFGVAIGSFGGFAVLLAAAIAGWTPWLIRRRTRALETVPAEPVVAQEGRPR